MMSDEVRQEKLAKARALMNKHGLHNWRVSFADLSHVPSRNLIGASFGVSGLCNFRNKHILVDWNVTQYQFLQVIKHEVAHALLGWPGHGAAWLAMAKRVGCSKRELSVYQMMVRVSQ